jgi:arylsulfatase A-like enzyme
MKPNIIFVLLDGSRWDRLHVSKEFSNLQKNGFLLNNVSAAYPYTFAAMNSIFTGLYGKENGVDAYYKMFKLKDEIEFLPELLQKNGYFTACDLITDKVISSRGFDVYQSHDEYNDDLTTKHPNFLKKIFHDSNDKPVFAFLQFSRIHTVTVSEILKKYDWDDEEFYSQKHQNLSNYDKVFQEAGIYAEIMKTTIEQISNFDETILIFFADHGTGIGERFGERNYGVFTFEETIRTFYLFLGNMFEKNRVSEKLFSSTSVFHTLLDLSQTKHGLSKSFLSYLCGKNDDFPSEPYSFSETGGLQGPHPSPKSPNVFCIKTSTHKLIFFKSTNDWKLFDLVYDPKEKENLIGKNLAIEDLLKNRLLEWINR